MNKAKRAALEAAGYVFGDAEDFLELSDEERALVAHRLDEARRLDEIRIAAGGAVRAARQARKLTQAQAAKVIGTQQPNVSKMEAASDDVSLDMMFRSYFTLGGTATVSFAPAKPAKKVAGRHRKPAG